MTGTIPSWTSNRLTYAYLYNNGFAGSLPALNTPYLYILDLHNNQISGNLPDMSGATRLQILYLNNNSIVGYTPEALKYNTILRTLDMSNNALNAGVGTNIISDLYDNYFLNPRSGVSINLLGNNGLSRDAIINDGSGQEENSTIAKLKYLEQFWTILLDLT
jgi:Leucine-rich repeat (LRR) protein